MVISAGMNMRLNDFVSTQPLWLGASTGGDRIRSGLEGAGQGSVHWSGSSDTEYGLWKKEKPTGRE